MNGIITLAKTGMVFDITPEMLGSRNMTAEEMVAIFNHFDAFWNYEGVPIAEKPHALLKSRKHSNGFVSCKNVLDYPKMCTLFAYEIWKHVRVSITEKIDVVASSAYSAINIGWELARIISVERNAEVRHVTVEKDPSEKPSIIRGGIDPSLNVLVINELMTTSDGSTWETKEAVLKCNGDKEPPNILAPSFVLVHRSKDLELPDGSKVYPIFHFDMTDFDVEKGEVCPYCEAGSEAIKPKVDNNWNKIHNRI